MTTPSPQPPPGTSTTIAPIMAGQTYPGPNGEAMLSAVDCVLVTLYTDGEMVCTFTRAPDTALQIAVRIQEAAAHIINNQVDDDGNKLSAMERLALINDAYRKADS